jgi:hypothetical protein
MEHSFLSKQYRHHADRALCDSRCWQPTWPLFHRYLHDMHFHGHYEQCTDKMSPINVQCVFYILRALRLRLEHTICVIAAFVELNGKNVDRRVLSAVSEKRV